MTDDLMRFLTVNSLLCGYKLTDCVSGDFEKMDRLLGTSRSKELEETFAAKPEIMGQVHPVLRSLINYFRTYQYAFVTPDGASPVKFSSIFESARAGQISEALEAAVVHQFIQKTEMVSKVEDVGVFDGCLYYTDDLGKDDIFKMFMRAYKIVLHGPTMTARDNVLKYAKYYSLAGFKSFSGAQALKVVNALASSDYSPRTYGQTCFIVPDLLKVYQATGLVMCRSEVRDNAVDWALDYVREEQSTKTAVVTVDYEMLRTLMVNGVSDLHSITYGGPKNPLVVKE